METPTGSAPERQELQDFTVDQIFEVFTREEILEIDAYFDDHIGTDQSDEEGSAFTLLSQPLPPGFAPDRADRHHMLLYNRLSAKPAGLHKRFQEDIPANTLRGLRTHHSPESQRALRLRFVILACVMRLEQEAIEARLLEEEAGSV